MLILKFLHIFIITIVIQLEVRCQIKTSYWPDGNKRSEIEYNDEGVKNGIFYRWYSNGNNEIIGEFLNGQEVGAWKLFYESGSIEKIKNYDCINNRIDEIRYYENGIVDFKGVLDCNNKRNGKYYYYSITGKLEMIKTFKDDKPDGEYIEYFSNGTIKSIGEYSPIEIVQIDTVILLLDDNTQVEKVISNNEFQKRGNWKYYNEEGELIKEETFPR